MSNRKYTEEQLDFIKDNVVGRSFAELTELFNERFGTDYPLSTIMSAAYRYGCHNGIDAKFNKGWEPTQFKKGHVPFNKGKKKWYPGGEETQFEKGNRPWNYKPVGTERINTDGYVEIKTADPKTWRMKHVLIWEKANGSVPKGHVLIFADGNRLNVTLDNLLLISRGELAVMNKRGLISIDAELTKVGASIAGVYLKIGERGRQAKGKRVKKV